MTDLLPPHLSFSSRKTLFDCAKKWELAKVHKAPELPSWALPGGSAVHQATEFIDRAALDIDTGNYLAVDREETFYGVDLSDVRLDGEAGAGETPAGWEVDADLPCMPGHTAESVFIDAWTRCVDDQVERNGFPADQFKATGRGSKEWPNGRDQDWWTTHGPLMVAAYIDWRFATRYPIALAPNTGVPGIEFEVGAEIGYPTKGSIDRVFILPSGELCIVDLKTGTSRNHPLQLAEYATQLEVLFGTRPKWGMFVTFPVTYGVVACKGGSPINLDGYTRGLFESMNRSAVAVIESGVFPPNVRSDCDWCSQAPNCAAVGGANAETFDPLYQIMHKENTDG